MRRHAIHVGCHDIWFDPISGDIGGGAAVIDRVDHAQQLPGARAVAQARKRHCRPDRRMGVLATIFAYARYITADVAGVQVGLVEGWVEQLDQRMVAPYQPGIDCLHGNLRAFGIAGAGQHGPALRNRIDLAFRIAGRAEWCAVVEISAPVPAAIPAVRLDVALQDASLFDAACTECAIALQVGDLRKARQHIEQEECQPHAFAAAFLADLVHTVVPVAGADQRQAVHAEAQAALDGAHAMLVQRADLVRAGRQVVI